MSLAFLEIKSITLVLIAPWSTAYMKAEYEVILCSSSYFTEILNTVWISEKLTFK